MVGFIRTSFPRALLWLALAAAVVATTARSAETPTAHAAPPEESARAAAAGRELANLLAPSGVYVAGGAQARSGGTVRRVQVHWEMPGRAAATVGAAQAAGTLTAGPPERASGELPRHRVLDLAESELLVVAVDGSARLLWWHVMSDPRQVRAETLDAAGHLSGGVAWLTTVDFPIAYPDDDAITELRLYHPEWTGTAYRLQPLAAWSVR